MVKRFFVIVSFHLILSGCGGSTSESISPLSQSEIPQPTEYHSTAADLGLRIVLEDASGKNPNIPDSSAALSVKTNLDIYTTNQDEIKIDTKLFLPDLKSLNPIKKRGVFLVWPEELLGSPIASANYSHRVKQTSGKEYGSSRPYPVHHDSQNHRWYISVQELFEHNPLYAADDANLDDSQIITLDLILADSSHKIIKIIFQVSGPMADTSLNSIPLVSPSGTDDLIRKTSESGFIIYEETIKNPTSRPFQIWLSHSSHSGALKLKSYLQEPQYSSHANTAPTGPNYAYYESIADLEVGELVAIHESLKVESFELQHDSWESITLEPFETLTLQWRAIASTSAVSCQLPLTRQAAFSWVYVRPPTPPTRTLFNFGPHGGGIWIDVPAPAETIVPQYFSETRTIDWSFVRGELVGSWNREIRLAHPFISKTDATRSLPSTGASAPPLEFKVLDQSTISTDIVMGSLPGSHTPYSCQGVFR
jgi:hypothetical protein